MRCPRSGTTLLQGMLTSHSQIGSFPETHFFERGFNDNRSLRSKRLLTSVLREFYLRLVLSAWVTKLKILGYEVPDSEKLGRSWTRIEVVGDFVRLLDSLILSNDKNVWVEKKRVGGENAWPRPSHKHNVQVCWLI